MALAQRATHGLDSQSIHLAALLPLRPISESGTGSTSRLLALENETAKSYWQDRDSGLGAGRLKREFGRKKLKNFLVGKNGRGEGYTDQQMKC